MRLIRRWSAWVCLSLMLWTVAAESTHNHSTQSDANSCSICVAAHSAQPAIGSHHAPPVFATVGLLQDEEVLVRPRLDVFELGIRGPPSVA